MESLIRQYVAGWIDGDAAAIIATLADDCTIIESHGPTYHGTEEVKRWVDEWNGNGSKVEKWDITSFHEMPPDGAVFEWHFECTVDGKKHSLDGISIAQFKGGKISYMREYRAVK